jgi:hypothetical protein
MYLLLEGRMTETDDLEWPPHLDAPVAAPANHRLLLKDDTVRVLQVSVEPGERENLHHHRWPSIMLVLARPNYVNRDANGNLIPPDGGMPADPMLPRAVRLPPQATHAIEVAADAPHRIHGIRIEFRTPEGQRMISPEATGFGSSGCRSGQRARVFARMAAS